MSKRKGTSQKLTKAHRKQAGVQKRPVPEKKRQPLGKKQQCGGDPHKHGKAPLSYTESQRILCVGEGNFSFARALVRQLEGQGQLLTATAYDTKETVLEKYEVSCNTVLESWPTVQTLPATNN